MPVFSPPPREQVLTGLYAQAERAHNLVEDLAAGSADASQQLLSLASQVLDRARMYQWPRVASWALALEERLAGWAPDEPASSSDLGWLRRHVARLETVLEPAKPGARAPSQPPDDPARSSDEEPPDGGAAPDRSEVGLERSATEPGTPLSELAEGSPDDPTGAAPGEPAGSAGLDLDLSELGAGEDVEVDVDEKWFELDRAAREGRDSSVGPAAGEAAGKVELSGPAEEEAAAEDVELSGPAEEEAAAEDVELSGPAEEEPSPREAPDQAPPRSSPDRADEMQVTAEFQPEIVEFMARELDEEAKAAEAGEEDGSPEPEAEHAADDDAEARPALGRLDLQRVRRRRRSTGEVAGPEQFVVVSVAEDPEAHLWLGKMLPERRFELLTARGAAEAELACREQQPDLVLFDWKADSDLTNHTVRRLRANPLTRYVRISLVADEDSLAARLAAARVGAVSVVSRADDDKTVLAQVLVAVLASEDMPDDTLGEASMEELSELLIDELRSELKAIRAVVGDVQVPVSGYLGQVLRETSARLGEGVEQALGGGYAAPMDEEDDDEDTIRVHSPFHGKRALLLESDRLRRSALAQELAELGLEVLPPVPDLTKALESGLAWAPDVLIGGAPQQDSLACVKILRRDIALSSMLWAIIRWDHGRREWPDPRADAAEQRPALRRMLTEAFAPISMLERRLAAAGDVDGRVESYGMPALLRLLLEARPSALLEVREGTDQFEGFVDGGQLLDARWTEADGTVTEHFEAFVRLLGVRRGSFDVTMLEGPPPEPAIPGALGELLAAACHWWRPLALKVDRRLHDIHALDLNNRRTAELKRQSAKPIRAVVTQLARGKTPGEVVAEGADRVVVAKALRELVRRLAVASLPTGEEGDDTFTTL